MLVALSKVYMYKKVTHGISVEIEVFFLTKQAKDNEELYVWAYKASIKNERDESIRIKDRHWHVTDIMGNSKDMHGEGIIGEHPLIKPNDSYEYMSGVPLFSPSGIMVGKYTIETEDSKKILDISIPAFSLDSPYQEPVIN